MFKSLSREGGIFGRRWSWAISPIGCLHVGLPLQTSRGPARRVGRSPGPGRCDPLAMRALKCLRGLGHCIKRLASSAQLSPAKQRPARSDWEHTGGARRTAVTGGGVSRHPLCAFSLSSTAELRAGPPAGRPCPGRRQWCLSGVWSASSHSPFSASRPRRAGPECL